VCDADTGACVVAGGAAAPTGGAAVGGAAGVGAVTPTVLEQESGWGSSIGLMLLVALLTISLVVVPAVVWRQYSRPAAA
jgi:hypothetical protein